MKTKTTLFIILFIFSLRSYSQCGPNVPSFTVNLTGNPAGTWSSPFVIRNDNCCGTTAPDRCVEFIITLDPAAQGIAFNITAGAIPGGALFYQIGCGPQHALGSPICLSGVGPHILTFCKPGNNNNVYSITSIPGPTGGTNVTINDGCIDTLHATGFNPATVTWNSIYPGTTGAYNSYLSCSTGCLNPVVTGSGTPPPYVDYVVCGQPAAQCNTQTVCDTVRVTFNPTLNVTIVPINPTICFGQTSTTITATGSGGTPPYSYLWNNVNPSQTISVGVGTYNVQLSDASGCPPVYNSVTVTAYTSAITANAGPDQNKCSQSPLTTLNGSITGASGGIWSGGAGTFSPNNTTLSNVNYTPSAAEIAAGHATLILTTTGNGTCPAGVDTVTINFAPFTGTVTPTVTNVSCFGGTDGTSTIAVSGGTGPYTYTWTTVPTQTTSTASGLGQGTYSVSITNGIGCVYQTTVAVTQPTPLSVSSAITDVSCNGGSNGSIAATGAGGTPAYSYSWSPGGQTTQTISGQPAGTYTVKVTDAKGCVTTGVYTIAQPTILTTTSTFTNVSCNGGTNGAANVVVTGGTPAYTYSWSPSGGTSSTAIGLPAGTYTLQATDSKGCVVTQTITITQPAVLTTTVSATNETCDYLNNGTASVVVAGGTPAYSYTWQPGNQTTAGISGQASGTYTVIVADTKGCTMTNFATITQPTPLAIAFSNQVNVSCFGGNDGSVSSTVSGGTPNYSYSWMPAGGSGANAGSLAAGTYTLTTTDANGCTASNTLTITQPTLALSVSSTIANVSCNGGSDGSITATAVGGTPAYSYSWSPGAQTTQTISGQPAGTYTVKVTDSKGCVTTGVYTITQPSTLTTTPTFTNVSCFGGTNGVASVTVSGGTPTYTYSWSPSGGTAATATGLSAGTYTLQATDSKGCVAIQTVTITQPTVLSTTVSVTNETCDYLNNGTASVTVTGGTPAYSYTWQPGNQTTSGISGQASGTYTVIVKDTKGCTITNFATITQPTPLAIAFSNQVNVSCFGGNNGSISSTVSGGTPNYSYSWSPGGMSGANASNLSAGTYTLTATDANGCTVSNTVTITQPAAPVSVSVSSVPPTCFGGTNGSISANGAGGTSPYIYSWMPGSLSGQTVNNVSAGTYTVTVTDSKGCVKTNTVTVTQPTSIVITSSSVNSTCGTANGQASASASGGLGPYTYTWMPGGVNTATLTGVASGSYTVFVNDANACPASLIVNVNDNGGPSASIIGITNVTCYGGSNGTATASVVGGTGTISYTWSPSGGNGPVATGLPAGTYVVMVTDQNGCQALATTSPGITQPPPITIAVTTTNVSCFAGNNGTASASASGGTPGFTYVWLPSNTPGTSISGLAAGIYTVQATDANSCVQTQTFSITQPTAALSVTPASTPALCFGGSSGTASSTASGGTSPYNYSWMPGGFSSQNISHLTAGTYTVNVTDSKGCVASNTVIVAQPPIISLAMASNNSTCGSANGQATVTASGGTPSYSYSWSPSGGSTNVAGGLNSGNYYVLVTDNNGCTATSSITVNNTPGPTVTVSSVTNVSCNGGADGTATAAVSGGTGTITYTWSPVGGNNQVGTGMSQGNYTVTIKDANGCQSAATTTLTQPPQILVNVTTNDVTCFGGSNGTATVSAGGGTPGFTFVWYPSNATGSTISGLTAGSVYTVEATDTKNCVETQIFAVSQPTALVPSVSAIGNVSCFGGNNGTATANVSGGTPFYNYAWVPSGGNGATGTGMTAGTYTVNITDAHGCTTFTTATITQPAQALSATSSANGASCFGGSNGTATITPAGGTPGYGYQWSPIGGNAQTASGLPAGSYNVQVNDANGCLTNISVTISQGTPITGNLLDQDPSCGFANGSITSQISGGTSPYSYSWNPGGATGATVTGLAPGPYTVQVTDALNCQQTFSTTLTNIPGPNVTIASSGSVSCYGGNNGSATINITSGTSPFTTSWSPFGGSGLTATSLTSGTYTATVTDALGCIATATTSINQPTQMNLSIAAVNNVLCNGGNNGSATIAAAGGTPAYTYAWNPSVSNTPTANNLQAGTYTVNVSDQNSCSTAITVIVTEPAVLTSTISSVSNAICYSGSGNASVSVSGGTAPYSYSWSSTPVQTGSTIQGVPSGTYSVNISDAHGCATQNTVTINQPLQVLTSVGANDTVCIGNTGAVTASASGGSGGYYYAWQPSGAITSGTYTTTATSAATYTVVAYDQNGCAGNPATVSIIVYSLGPANVHASGISPICPGHSSTIYVQTTGVTGPLSYTWSNNLGFGPGAYVVTPTQPTTYYVTVANTCGSSVTDSVPVKFNPPPTLIMFTDSNVICIPTAIHFTDSSLTGNPNDPITSWYWNFGDGTSSTQQNPTHSYISPGTFSVTLSIGTNGGCVNSNASAPYVISAYPYPHAAFSMNHLNSSNQAVLNIPYDELVCTNQSQSALTYNWNFGDGGVSSIVNPHHTYSTIGTYTVQLIATNAHGCSDTATGIVITNTEVIFPNAFTPNPEGPNGGSYTFGDLTNDVFFPYTKGVTDFKLQVFNRWGELIFESLDINIGWDGYYRGKLCQQDVYVWKAYMKFNNGKTFSKSGDVTLLR
ncbi:MAG: PKD domain-containing protein [Bacteroidia bacterium]